VAKSKQKNSRNRKVIRYTVGNPVEIWCVRDRLTDHETDEEYWIFGGITSSDPNEDKLFNGDGKVEGRYRDRFGKEVDAPFFCCDAVVSFKEDGTVVIDGNTSYHGEGDSISITVPKQFIQRIEWEV
jgi:hypothetical protein